MNKPHVHADIIKAWADGAIIQYWRTPYGWEDTSDNDPAWCPDAKYRVKPEPEIFTEKMSYYYVGLDGDLLRWSGLNKHNAHLRLIVDTKTNKIKSAEVL